MHQSAARRNLNQNVTSSIRVFESLEGRRMLSVASTGVSIDGGKLVFDSGADISRALTPVEQQWLNDNPGAATAGSRIPTSPPTGPIRTVAEYEPMEALVMSWAGSSTQKTTIAQIVKRITVDAGGRVYVGVNNATDQAAATTAFNGQLANLANVTFFTVPIDTIWARDYGPRYVYEDNVRVIADHDYNRPRPNDDNQPIVFSQFKRQQLYQMGLGGTELIHGGGNYHLSGNGDAYSTSLITTENNPPSTATSLSAAQIQQIWNTYQGNNTTITNQFPLSVDSTGHIDMWMQIYADNKVFVSDWPSNSGSAQDVISDNTAALMQSRGYEVTRLPAYSISGVHYTYANMVMFNNIVLVPSYTSGPGATVSAQALATIQAALPPGKIAVAISGQSLVTSAGVFHCIVQHLPMHKGLAGTNGGLAPTAYLRGPNATTTFNIGDQYNLQWISDDDGVIAATQGVQAVDLLLSTDGGATFPTVIASNQPALGSFLWNIPAGLETTQARIKVVARDAAANTGFDLNDAHFTIDTLAPSITSAAFAFETEQRIDVLPSEAATLTGATLTNLTTAEMLSGAAVSITPNDATISIRKSAGLLPDGNWRVTALTNLTDTAGNQSSPNFPIDFFILAADATRDRAVNLDDFTALAANFGQANRVFSQGNFDYSPDGVVNLDDFTLLASQFGKTLAVPSDVPRAFARTPISPAKPQAEEPRFSTTRIIDDILAS